jgi:hypothetical protein
MSSEVVVIIVLEPDYKAAIQLKFASGSDTHRCDNQTQGRLYISELKVNA